MRHSLPRTTKSRPSGVIGCFRDLPQRGLPWISKFASRGTMRQPLRSISLVGTCAGPLVTQALQAGRSSILNFTAGPFAMVLAGNHCLPGGLQFRELKGFEHEKNSISD